MGGDLERAERRVVGAAERAQAALGARLPSVARAQATLAYLSRRLRGGTTSRRGTASSSRGCRDAADRQAALSTEARSGHRSHPRPVVTVDAAVGDARAAGIYTAVAIGSATLATWLPYDESERALGLLDEAIEVGTRNRRPARASRTRRRQGEDRVQTWRLANSPPRSRRRRRTDRRTRWSRSREPVPLLGRCRVVRAGSCEPAAVVLSGTPTTIAGRWDRIGASNLRAATDAALLEALGEQQVAGAGQLAALDIADAVAFVRLRAPRCPTLRRAPTQHERPSISRWCRTGRDRSNHRCGDPTGTRTPRGLAVRRARRHGSSASRLSGEGSCSP